MGHKFKIQTLSLILEDSDSMLRCWCDDGADGDDHGDGHGDGDGSGGDEDGDDDDWDWVTVMMVGGSNGGGDADEENDGDGEDDNGNDDNDDGDDNDDIDNESDHDNNRGRHCLLIFYVLGAVLNPLHIHFTHPILQMKRLRKSLFETSYPRNNRRGLKITCSILSLISPPTLTISESEERQK